MTFLRNKRITLLQCILATSVVLLCPLTAYAIAADSGQELQKFPWQWALFSCAVAVAGYTLYLGKQRRLIVFSSYTDVACTILSLILPMAATIALSPLPDETIAGIFLLPMLFIAKATWASNRRLIGFLLALFTKLFLVSVWILALVLVILMAFSSDRRKYERKTRHSRRQTAAALAGASGVTAAFAFLTNLGLYKYEFVSLKHWITGDLS